MCQIYKKNRTIFYLYMSTSLSVFSQDAKDSIIYRVQHLQEKDAQEIQTLRAKDIQKLEYYDLPNNLHKADKKRAYCNTIWMCNMLFYLSLKGLKRVIYTRPSSSREVHLRLSCRMRV